MTFSVASVRKQKRFHEALRAFNSLQTQGSTFRLLPSTYAHLFLACSQLKSIHHGRLAHRHLSASSMRPDIVLSNHILNMYGKCGVMEEACKLFEEMPEINIVSWTSMISGFSQNCRENEAVDLYIRMLRSGLAPDQFALGSVVRTCLVDEAIVLFLEMRWLGLKPDDITVRCLLCACSDYSSLYQGQLVHSYLLKVGLDADVSVCNALLSMYTRSLELFALMRGLGINPNHVTLVGVLTACSCVGFVDEGLYYYNIMEHEYGIVPTKEHSSCVIDLLARAGRLNEAAKFIDQMPFEPGIVMWKTLLAACRVRNNVEIGKRAAEAILKIDPSDSAAYVLLCSIYASSGHWDEFAMLKKLMKSSGVRKFPGKNWIKVNGELRVFIVEDKSQPESENVYTMLELLGIGMTEVGYVSKLSYCKESINLPVNELVSD
uniref:Pentatricopeptide repeat-containing protein n=1 Tax=Ananas comosus var. bracteatus TaxID=296719 RepID=A0A6V7Q9B7_ANACO|nr:unnamed protein product [Ananas comosus var. bracteatus]